METDLKLRKRVIQELEWEPSIDAHHITVDISDGVVSLTGHVASHAEKQTAEEAVRRVRGVRALVENLEVSIPEASYRSDAAIARAAASAVEWDVRLPQDGVTVTVEKGVVTLDGEVEGQYQRDAAVRAVSSLMGVTRVVNHLRITPRAVPPDVKEDIEAALARRSPGSAQAVGVTVVGGKVILDGTVESWHDREEAECIAWAAPGVTAVENKVIVQTPDVVAD